MGVRADSKTRAQRSPNRLIDKGLLSQSVEQPPIGVESATLAFLHALDERGQDVNRNGEDRGRILLGGNLDQGLEKP